MRYQGKWADRRSASGSLKPFIFLIIEVTALCMACWFVSLFGILFMTILASVGAMYFFMTSTLARYHKVVNRQQYSHYD